MRLSRTIGFIFIAVACGGDGGITGPDDDNTLGGLTLTASVTLVDVTEATGSRLKMVSVDVVVRNATDATIERSYPAGCPVRMRLYAIGSDVLVYDQAQFACNMAAVVPLTLGPQESKSITSGQRFPWDVAGDSLAAGTTYRATGVLRITGENPIELEAGTYRIPVCTFTGGVPVCN